MKFSNVVQCTAIKESIGEIEGRPFSSTTFHLVVDLAENNAGRSMGVVTRPFKFGDGTEYEKWAHLAKSWPALGIQVLGDFEVVAAADNKSNLVLLGIKPAPAAPKA